MSSFQRLQKGDKFKLIYREQQVEGVSVGISQIDAIYFEHFGNSYYAFPLDQGRHSKLAASAGSPPL